MINALRDGDDRQAVNNNSTMHARRMVILINGGFLALIGGAQVIFELIGHHTGAGPYGAVFKDSPYTIGWVENHGFAFLIGVLFLTVAARDGRRFWHVFALAVHILLAAANLTFWSSFVTFGVVPMGIAATVAHAVFILAHAWCLASSRGAARAPVVPASTS